MCCNHPPHEFVIARYRRVNKEPLFPVGLCLGVSQTAFAGIGIDAHFFRGKMLPARYTRKGFLRFSDRARDG
jgi:hypothetical protein